MESAKNIIKGNKLRRPQVCAYKDIQQNNTNTVKYFSINVTA